MPWIRLDDGFHDNPINRRLGPAGRDLFIASLGWCTKGLTDGRIDKADLPLLLQMAQAKRPLVAKLIESGRWIDHGDHVEVVGYLSYQPSKEQVVAQREAERERKRRQRAAGARQTPRNGADGRYVPGGTPAGTPTGTPVVTPGGTPAGCPPLPVPSRPPLLDTSLGVTSSPAGQGQDQEGVDFEHHPKPQLSEEQRAELVAGVRALRPVFFTPDDVA